MLEKFFFRNENSDMLQQLGKQSEIWHSSPHKNLKSEFKKK